MMALSMKVDNCILLKSGRYFNLLDPEGAEITINDIAHALSNTCRFGGHTKQFYSVAQHSVMVSQLVPAEDQLEGLMHDMAEAILVDMPTPVKMMLPDYQALEHRINAALCKQFGLRNPMPASIKKADLIMLATERRDLMPANDAEWPILKDIEPWPLRIIPRGPEEALDMFMMRYVTLADRKKA